MSRKGFSLLVVLVIASFISMSAMLLFSTVSLDMMIVGNTLRINQAKISAASGLSHFTALGFTYNTLRERAGDLQTLQILPETQLGGRTSYEVKVHFSPSLNSHQYIVESIGYYKKANKIISAHPIKALFQGEQ